MLLHGLADSRASYLGVSQLKTMLLSTEPQTTVDHQGTFPTLRIVRIGIIYDVTTLDDYLAVNNKFIHIAGSACDSPLRQLTDGGRFALPQLWTIWFSNLLHTTSMSNTRKTIFCSIYWPEIVCLYSVIRLCMKILSCSILILIILLSSQCINSNGEIIKSVRLCVSQSVSQSVCHMKRAERSTDRNPPPIFTKLATEIDSRQMWLSVIFWWKNLKDA